MATLEEKQPTAQIQDERLGKERERHGQDGPSRSTGEDKTGGRTGSAGQAIGILVRLERTGPAAVGGGSSRSAVTVRGVDRHPNGGRRGGGVPRRTLRAGLYARGGKSSLLQLLICALGCSSSDVLVRNEKISATSRGVPDLTCRRQGQAPIAYAGETGLHDESVYGLRCRGPWQGSD